jgi:hypothetical protein
MIPHDIMNFLGLAVVVALALVCYCARCER